MKKRILLSGLFLMILLGWMSTGQLFAQNHQSSSGSVNDKVDYVNYMNSLRANPATGTINPIDIQRAHDQVDQMKATKSTKALNLNWTELGPDNFAGRTRCLLIERSNPSILFAGSTGGGLWKSTSSGTSWTQVNLAGPTMVISSISQGSDNAIYIATGDANSMYVNIGSGNSNEVPTYFGIGYMGNGIWKSTDLGATFTQLTSTIPVSNDTTSDFMAISKILVHPANANIVYAATRKAFKMSTDGGNTWITVTDNNGTPLTGKCTDVEAHSDGTVAVAVNGLLYVSNDGSSGSFVKKSTGGFHQLPSATSTRMEIAIAPSNSSYIYVVRVGTNCDIYQCTFKGDSASLIGPGGSLSFNIFGIATNNVGWYAMALAVSPSNAGKIYCGGYDMWTWESGTNWVQKSSGSLFEYTDPSFLYYFHHAYVFQNSSVMYIATDGGIQKSFDGGSSFMTLNKNYKTAQFFSITEHANGNVMGGTQGNGTLLFDTTGNTPQTAKLVIGNYESAGSSTYFGTDGGYCSFSLLNPEVVYASGAKHRFARSIDKGANFTSPGDLMNRLYNSTYSYGSYLSPATLWESFNDTYSPDSALYFYNGPDTILSTLWVQSNICRDMTFPVSYPQTIHNGDSLYFQDKLTSKMFMGLKDYAFMTRGAHNFLNGPSWWKIAKFNGTSTAIAVSRDGNNCFIGTSNGKLIRVSNLNLAIDSLKGDIDKPSTCLLDTMQIYNFGNRTITSIFVDIHDGNKVLVTLGNYGCNDYVYYSTNALDTINPVVFTSKQGNLPKNPVYTSLIEMNNSNLVLVGTDMGLFATTDINAATPTWTDESGTAPGHVPVFALNQMNNAISAPTDIRYKGYYYGIYNLGSITMATQGRGAFRSNSFVGINDPKNNSTSSEDLLMVFPNPAKESASVAITLKKSSDVILTVYDLQGKHVAGETFKNRTVGNHKLTLNVGGLQSGNYLVVVDAEGTSKSGKLIIVK